MTVPSRFTGYFAGLLAAAFWGIHSVIIRHLTEQGIDPYLIAGMRLYIGVLTIFVIVSGQKIFRFARGVREKEHAFTFNGFFWLGALSLGVNFLFFQKGLEYTLASDANLIQNFSPVAVLIISSIFLRHRVKEIAPTQTYWTSVFQIVLVGSIGASLVLINDVNDIFVPSQTKLWGDLIEFIGMIFFSIFIICSSEYAKTQSGISSLRTTMVTLAVAAVPVTFFVPFSDFAKLTMEQWSWIIFIGVFSTGFAYWFWHIASKRLNVIPLTLNLVYIGIITVLSEITFLKLTIDWKFIVGGILMIFASVSAELINHRAQKYLRQKKQQIFD